MGVSHPLRGQGAGGNSVRGLKSQTVAPLSRRLCGGDGPAPPSPHPQGGHGSASAESPPGPSRQRSLRPRLPSPAWAPVRCPSAPRPPQVPAEQGTGRGGSGDQSQRSPVGLGCLENGGMAWGRGPEPGVGHGSTLNSAPLPRTGVGHLVTVSQFGSQPHSLLLRP